MKAVVFDLDGLMFNTEDLYDIVCDEVLKKRGKRFSPELKKRMMGLTAGPALQIMIDTHGLTDSIADLKAGLDDEFELILDDMLQPMPGLLDLLDFLETKGLPKAIATSSHRAFVNRTLAISNLADRFEFVLTSEDVTNGKPAPEIYLKAAEQHGVSPAEMLVLEDSENGNKAAVAAGAVAVAVPNRHTKDHDFTGVRLVANSLADPRIRELLE